MLKHVKGCLLGVTWLGMAIATKSSAASPAADTDLICPTDNPMDCYSRIFQPTEDFQVVREGQDIPLGLHVRMNIWTGEKEARLNIPLDGDNEMDDLPTEQSVVVIDQPQDLNFNGEPALRDRVPQKPPGYDPAGKILPPREPGDSGGEMGAFWNAIRAFDGDSVSDEDIESALADLSDLVHDIYYGVELAKQVNVLQSLVALMSSDSHSPQQRRQAALVLGISVQNNPTALKEARKAWESSTYPNSGKKYTDKRACEPENLINRLYQSLRQETDPAVTRAKISALAGLTKDPDMRDCFVVSLGMGHLLSIFLKEGEQWDSTRVKIAQFVMDTFLDEDMGAQLGVWPRGPAMDNQICRDPVLRNDQGCWEYHLGKMAQERGEGTDAWLPEFLRLLKRSTDTLPGARKRPVDREL